MLAIGASSEPLFASSPSLDTYTMPVYGSGISPSKMMLVAASSQVAVTIAFGPSAVNIASPLAPLATSIVAGATVPFSAVNTTV